MQNDRMTAWADHAKTFEVCEEERAPYGVGASKKSPYYDTKRMGEAIASEKIKVPSGLSRDKRLQFILSIASSKR
mgnify:CR=1 FL=1